MIYPKNIATLFTTFLLDINTWQYTTWGKSSIALIQTAAATGSPVTAAEYDSYTQYTAWRFETFEQHNALTS